MFLVDLARVTPSKSPGQGPALPLLYTNMLLTIEMLLVDRVLDFRLHSFEVG